MSDQGQWPGGAPWNRLTTELLDEGQRLGAVARRDPILRALDSRPLAAHEADELIAAAEGAPHPGLARAEPVQVRDAWRVVRRKVVGRAAVRLVERKERGPRVRHAEHIESALHVFERPAQLVICPNEERPPLREVGKEVDISLQNPLHSV